MLNLDIVNNNKKMVSVPMSLRFCHIILDNSLHISKCIRTQGQNQFHKCFWNATTATFSTEATKEKQKPEGEDIEATTSEEKIQTEQLSKQIESLRKEKSEFEDKYKRSLADGENLRKRLTKQIEDAKVFGIQSFCKDLLEVADILGKATECVPKEEVSDNNPHLKNLYEGLTLTEAELKKVSDTLGDSNEDSSNTQVHLKNLYKGLRMTEAVFHKVFNRHGLIPVNPLNEKFNPNFHEALFQQEVEGKEAGTVVVVSKIGYKLHERCIRPALVGVAKGS